MGMSNAKVDYLEHTDVVITMYITGRAHYYKRLFQTSHCFADIICKAVNPPHRLGKESSVNVDGTHEESMNMQLELIIIIGDNRAIASAA